MLGFGYALSLIETRNRFGDGDADNLDLGHGVIPGC